MTNPRLAARASNPRVLRTSECLKLGVIDAPLAIVAHARIVVVGRTGMGASAAGKAALAVFKSTVSVELLIARGYQVGNIWSGSLGTGTAQPLQKYAHVDHFGF